jgi:hypothetical protein
MLFRTVAIAVLLASFTLPAVAAGPNAAVMATVNGVIAAADADNAGQVNSYFASSAHVVDDFAPYVWSGSDAGSRWWTASDKDAAKHGVTDLRATLQPITHYGVAGDDAYVVLPLALTYTLKGKPGHTNGLWTLTLHQSGGSWKITSATWATTSGSM